jgi:hypothetical protein
MPGFNPYLPGKSPPAAGPLSRFLPPIPGGIAAEWLNQHLLPGAWVLDPFGASPHVAVETARAGYRVLVAANNPVARFLLEITANPPQESDLRAVLADLAASFKGDERIEPHIRSLYLTNCARCGQEIMAEAFLWDRGAQAPFGKIYTCPHCGDSGERPATEADASQAARFTRGGLHWARALERVASPSDPDRSHAEEALETYLPRAVYALFTLLNKLDRLAPTQDITSSHTLLSALLLAAADRANSLWPYPTARARPKQLLTPPRFRENNIWLALEEAVDLWAGKGESAPLRVTIWPEAPSEAGGICIFEGRLKNLYTLEQSESAPGIHFDAALAAIPRPNQAYWTLCALWAGWLWGREAAASFKSVLRRRRYDWAWHTNALTAALNNLHPLLDKGSLFFSIIGEVEPGFLSAALVSGNLSAFSLSGLALRAETGQAQITWTPEVVSAGPSEPVGDVPKSEHPSPALSAWVVQQIIGDCVQAAQEHLRQRGEPASYLHLHAAGLVALVESPILKSMQESSPAEVLQQVQTAIQSAFAYRYGFLRYGGSEHSLEVGFWWLRESDASNLPSGETTLIEPLTLADRLEVALVRFLIRHPDCRTLEVDRAMCQTFPGLLTPSPGLIRTCLESYGTRAAPQGGIPVNGGLADDAWRLRDQDDPRTRHEDLQSIKGLIEQVGTSLGYQIDRSDEDSSPRCVIWLDAGKEPDFVFYLLASAVFGRLVFTAEIDPRRTYIVLPGGRANLVAYKLDADPRLRQEIDKGWRFLKFRHLRNLADSGRLGRENLEEQLGLDPLANSDPQMQLL